MVNAPVPSFEVSTDVNNAMAAQVAATQKLTVENMEKIRKAIEVSSAMAHEAMMDSMSSKFAADLHFMRSDTAASDVTGRLSIIQSMQDKMA